ncbi:MAG: GNAT family N-acetyltransferase [Candidatus Hodarchaeota archaeon]
MKFKVRNAVQEDLETLVPLMKELVEIFDEKFDDERSRISFKKILADPIQSRCIIVAESEDARVIMGMITSEVKLTSAGDTTGIIKNLIVKEKFRKKGVGKELVRKALERLKEIPVKDVLVNIRDTQVFALKIYNEMGFKKKFSVMSLSFEGE